MPVMAVMAKTALEDGLIDRAAALLVARCWYSIGIGSCATGLLLDSGEAIGMDRDAFSQYAPALYP